MLPCRGPSCGRYSRFSASLPQENALDIAVDTFHSLVSISAVREWCIYNPPKNTIKKTLALEAQCFYSFFYMDTKTPEKFKPLLHCFGFPVESVFSTRSWSSLTDVVTLEYLYCVPSSWYQLITFIPGYHLHGTYCVCSLQSGAHAQLLDLSTSFLGNRRLHAH